MQGARRRHANIQRPLIGLLGRVHQAWRYWSCDVKRRNAHPPPPSAHDPVRSPRGPDVFNGPLTALPGVGRLALSRLALALGAALRRPALADPDRLDAIVADRLDADRVAVRGDGVAAARQAARAARRRTRRPSCRRRCRRAGAGRSRPGRSRRRGRARTSRRSRAGGSRRAVGSVSSAISPTTSSMMSSTLTTPTTRPYSSTTTASEVRSRCRSASRSSSGLVSGTIIASWTTGSIERVRAVRHQQPRQLATCTMPFTRSRSSFSVTTRRVWPLETQQPQRRFDVLRDVERDDRRDRRHHLARLLLVQVEDAAEHARLAGVDVPAGVGLGDQALELVGRAPFALPVHVDARAGAGCGSRSR